MWWPRLANVKNTTTLYPLLNPAFCLPLSVHLSHSVCALVFFSFNSLPLSLSACMMKGFTLYVCIHQIPRIPAILCLFWSRFVLCARSLCLIIALSDYDLLSREWCCLPAALPLHQSE